MKYKMTSLFNLTLKQFIYKIKYTHYIKRVFSPTYQWNSNKINDLDIQSFGVFNLNIKISSISVVYFYYCWWSLLQKSY